jgi:hypothetical protein
LLHSEAYIALNVKYISSSSWYVRARGDAYLTNPLKGWTDEAGT